MRILKFLFVSIIFTLIFFSIISWVKIEEELKIPEKFNHQVREYRNLKSATPNTSLKLYNGLKIDKFLSKEDNKNLFIITHGINDGKERNVKVIKLLLKNGYDVISYDERSVGQNKDLAKLPSMGFFESKDLNKIVNYYKNRYKSINLYGVSMGATTTLKFLEDNDNNKINSVIVDAPFINAWNTINDDVKKSIPIGLNWGPNYIINGINKLIRGYSYNDVNIETKLKKIKVRTLILSPNHDPRILKNKNFDKLKKIINKNIQFKEYKSNKHAQGYDEISWFEYKQIIKEFIK